jgi:hypothetical protein
MEYMLLYWFDEDTVAQPDVDETAAHQIRSWLEEMTRRDVLRHGDRLRPVSDTTSVRVRNDGLTVLDGPFAETKEQVGGYDVVECADLDEAIEVASKHPVAAFGTVEVRPVWPF